MIKFARIDALTLNQIIEYLGINILTRQQQLSRSTEVDDEGVHVICTTVHKSKGLEYGTVILPYTFEDISDIKKVKLEANYNDSRLSYTVLFENGIRERNSNYCEDREVDEQIAEETRILYVALTRAIRNCIWINNIDSAPHISWATLLEG
jgi:ATP-dependent exoDNAse (exonuclease V) beta subunit